MQLAYLQASQQSIEPDFIRGPTNSVSCTDVMSCETAESFPRLPDQLTENSGDTLCNASERITMGHLLVNKDFDKSLYIDICFKTPTKEISTYVLVDSGCEISVIDVAFVD